MNKYFFKKSLYIKQDHTSVPNLRKSLEIVYSKPFITFIKLRHRVVRFRQMSVKFEFRMNNRQFWHKYVQCNI